MRTTDMSEKITVGMVQDQITGLQRTQSEAVWIRSDILHHILGDKAKEYIVKSVNMNETPTKTRNLVKAMKERKAGLSYNNTLVCIDREGALKAILDAVAKKVASSQKKTGGEA